jgi:hypothetical protein
MINHGALQTFVGKTVGAVDPTQEEIFTTKIASRRLTRVFWRSRELLVRGEWPSPVVDALTLCFF